MSRYQEAGVDIHAGYELVNKIKKDVKSTRRVGTTGNIGSFGGTFDLSVLNIKEPVLVSGTDGVGTKLLIAQKMDKHDTIGIDCVAMCVNDILAQGAEPLYFLDYIATGKNDPDKIAQIVAGVAEGCRQAGTALIGGETAEMPDMYAKDEYDLAGFSSGVVEKSKLLTDANPQENDILIGLASSGIHSNGFSLVRQILFKDNKIDLLSLQEHAIATLSCKASLKGNSHLSIESMQTIVDNLMRCDNPYVCPHGRPTIIHYSAYELEKLFKRVV